MSASQPTQEFRSVKFFTPLGDDVLLLHKMRGKEEVSSPFRYDLDLLSADPTIKYEDILGKNVTVELERAGGGMRCFNGHVSHFAYVGQTGQNDELSAYKATIVPWLWFLTRTSDYRIFQDETVPDIVTRVFSDHGFTDVEVPEGFSSAYQTWDNCVQLGETDFDFVSRLLEHEGISYWFKHELTDGVGKHTLVLANADTVHEDAPEDKVSHDDVEGWSVSYDLQPGGYRLNDYNFLTPQAPLEAIIADPKSHDHGGYEIYEYPGKFDQTVDGQNMDGYAYARMRLEERQAGFELARGSGTADGLCAGYLFKLKDHPYRTEWNRKYLILSTEHEIENNAPLTGIPSDPGCTVKFEAIPETQPYRPPRRTPKPVAQGLQTATVIAPPDNTGQEIWMDGHGRVRVRFHWDRPDQDPALSSCFIRVAQGWAGNGWGTQFIPRVGHEVLVSFERGDPDRPIVTGSVYNADNKLPYAAHPTQSGIKTRSSEGGGTSDFNEIRFEDKHGEEQVYLQAQKDLEVKVKGGVVRTIDGSGLRETINGIVKPLEEGEQENRTLVREIGGRVEETIDGNVNETIHGNVNIKATGESSYTIDANDVTLRTRNLVARICTGGKASVTGGKAGLTGGTFDVTGGAAKFLGEGFTGALTTQSVVGLKADYLALKILIATIKVDLVSIQTGSTYWKSGFTAVDTTTKGTEVKKKVLAFMTCGLFGAS